MRASSMPPSRERGVALIVSLIILVVVTLIGLSGVQIASQEERMAANAFDRSLGFQGAEAALRVGEELAKTEAAKAPPNDGFPGKGVYADADNTCPSSGSTCASGLCQQPDKDCTARWLDEDFEGWADADSIALSGLAETPQYIVEYLGESFPCDLNNPGTFDSCKRYRITARSGSGSDRAVVILQSIYATE